MPNSRLGRTSSLPATHASAAAPAQLVTHMRPAGTPVDEGQAELSNALVVAAGRVISPRGRSPRARGFSRGHVGATIASCAGRLALGSSSCRGAADQHVRPGGGCGEAIRRRRLVASLVVGRGISHSPGKSSTRSAGFTHKDGGDRRCPSDSGSRSTPSDPFCGQSNNPARFRTPGPLEARSARLEDFSPAGPLASRLLSRAMRFAGELPSLMERAAAVLRRGVWGCSCSELSKPV
jgi:hypothetical protein